MPELLLLYQPLDIVQSCVLPAYLRCWLFFFVARRGKQEARGGFLFSSPPEPERTDPVQVQGEIKSLMQTFTVDIYGIIETQVGIGTPTVIEYGSAR